MTCRLFGKTVSSSCCGKFICFYLFSLFLDLRKEEKLFLLLQLVLCFSFFCFFLFRRRIFPSFLAKTHKNDFSFHFFSVHVLYSEIEKEIIFSIFLFVRLHEFFYIIYVHRMNFPLVLFFVTSRAAELDSGTAEKKKKEN